MINMFHDITSPLHFSLTQQENTQPLDAARFKWGARFILWKDKDTHDMVGRLVNWKR